MFTLEPTSGILQIVNSRTPRFRTRGSVMQKRRRFMQTVSLEERLAQEAERLREEAKSFPTGQSAKSSSAQPDKQRPALT